MSDNYRNPDDKQKQYEQNKTGQQGPGKSNQNPMRPNQPMPGQQTPKDKDKYR